MKSRFDKDKPQPDLAQTILKWAPASVEHGPVEELIELPARHETASAYCKSFIPLILEDARAIIVAGLEKLKTSVGSPIILQNVSQPKRKGQPVTMTFKGDIETDEDAFLSMCIVLLFKINNNRKEDFFFGSASLQRDQPSTILVRAYPDDFVRDRGSLLPNSNVRNAQKNVWNCLYLGSIATHIRMFDACCAAEDLNMPLMSTICKAGTIRYPPVSHHPLLGALNRSQTDAVYTVLSGQPFVLLQGPPGTGKTTTVVTLLEHLIYQKKRVLVCAPSNKAVEVIAAKYHLKFPDSPVLLIGAEARIKPEFASISLSVLVNATADGLRNSAAVLEGIMCDYGGKTLLKETWNIVHAKLKAVEGLLDSILAIVRMYSVLKLVAIVGSVKQGIINFSLGIERRLGKTPQGVMCKFEELVPLMNSLSCGVPEDDFLNNARVIFCTLSVSGRRNMLSMDAPIDALIVDEAGQSVEAETLIALQHRPARVLLVGDTKQLPATVISTYARDHNYGWSMMHRLADRCGVSMLMLEEQYRMHPAISAWPSTRYYDGKLRDGAGIPHRPRRPNCPKWMRPLAFYDIAAGGRKETFVGTSPENALEALYIVYAVKKLLQKDPEASVGIITPYAAQVECVKNQLAAMQVNMDTIRVSSVDGFQGDECDYIFISFVRCGYGIGFVGDCQRLNVAVTRARYGLLMVGAVRTLKQSGEFKSLFKHLRASKAMRSEKDLRNMLGLPQDDLKFAQVLSSNPPPRPEAAAKTPAKTAAPTAQPPHKASTAPPAPTAAVHSPPWPPAPPPLPVAAAAVAYARPTAAVVDRQPPATVPASTAETARRTERDPADNTPWYQRAASAMLGCIEYFIF